MQKTGSLRVERVVMIEGQGERSSTCPFERRVPSPCKIREGALPRESRGRVRVGVIGNLNARFRSRGRNIIGGPNAGSIAMQAEDPIREA